MSNPRFDWWGYVKGMIRRYPALKAEYAHLRSQRLTPLYEERTGGRGFSRAAETAALMELPKTSMREFYAVQRAVAETERLPSGAERLGLVSLVFWRQTHSLEGAAQELHLSYRTARRYHEEFIKLVGAAFGLMDM